MSTPSTFAAALADRLRHDPGAPLVTFYDDATGERVELSVTTYANWVAKAAGLLAEEHDLERGMRLRIDLPTHWLGPVFAGAAWTVGLTLVDVDEDGEVDAVVCGPDRVEAWAVRAQELPVLACSLLPLGVRFRDPLPPGVHDVGVEVWSQPDAFTPWDAPEGDDLAWSWSGDLGPRGATPAQTTQAETTQAGTTQAEMLKTAAAGSLLTDGGRLLTVANPTSPSGLATFTEPLVRRGSVVLVAAADADRLDAVAAQERVSARHQPAMS